MQNVDVSEIRAFKPPKVSCVQTDLADVANPWQMWVLAMPYNVLDTYRSYFGPETDIRSELAAERIPVFDAHGLGGRRVDAQPLGHVVRWEERDTGRWALVELDKSDERAPDFVRAAAECRLGVSVGMLRAAMHPPPPLDSAGVYPEPTLLISAPVVEVSLLVESEYAPSNPAAVAGYQFTEDRMCEKVENSADELRAQIDALRAEVERAQKDRDTAIAEVQMLREQARAERAAQRMAAMQLPASLIDEFLNIYHAVSEGAQDSLIDLVGRMIDHVRSTVSTDANPAFRADSLRAALTRQMTPYEQRPDVPDESQQMIKDDLRWIRSQFHKKGESK